LTRNRQTKEALEFAQHHLRQYSLHDPSSLSEIIPLLAYKEPETSPVGHFLTQQYREALSKFVNSKLLEWLNMESETSLERLMQHLTVLKNETKAFKNKKDWSLQEFLQNKIGSQFQKHKSKSNLESSNMQDT